MGHLIIGIFRLITKYFISLIVILMILYAGKWFYVELQSAVDLRTRLTQLQSARIDLGKELLNAANQFERQIKAITEGGFGDVTNQKLASMLAGREAEKKTIISRNVLGLPSSVDDFKRLAVLEMEISTLRAVKSKAEHLGGMAIDLKNGREQWAALSKEHDRLLDDFNDLSSQIQIIRDEHPVKFKVLGTTAFNEIDRLIESEKVVKKQADELRQRIESVKLAVELKEKNLTDASKAFGLVNANVDAVLKASDELIVGEFTRQSRNFFSKVAQGIYSEFQALIEAAFYVLLGVIFVPIGIKLAFYYVLAPAASRRSPIRILERDETVLPVAMARSAEVSLELEVKSDEEMLIHSEHLQSSSIKTRKTTQWFLNGSFPLTSIGAGLYALTRIAPSEAEKVVVSSGKGLEMRLSAIDLPHGATLVMQPRGLMGVIQQRSNPLKIQSVWRVFSLHSWLTLQIRYLVFHGPAKLIVRGSRGVRMEAAGDGRMINESATLGFSAGAKYSVRRCETFVAYWRGVEELFNDQFDGVNCVYLFEEMPDPRRKGNILSRGLEGVTDSMLKVFGI